MARTQMTRRHFLLVGGATFGAAAAGCVSTGQTTTPSPPRPIAPLSGDKIQPPQQYGLSGAYVGVHLGHYMDLNQALDHYYSFAGKKPSFVMLPHYGMSHIAMGMTTRYLHMLETCANAGIVPFISYNAGTPNEEAHLVEIASGTYDDQIKSAARDLNAFGESHGGFFIRTMEYMNAGWYSNINWGRALRYAHFKDTWIRIWQIFEETGTNRYATWVFNPYVPSHTVGQRYYPGDQYVDWVAMGGYNMKGLDPNIISTRFGNLFNSAHRKVEAQYAGKPIMIGETGMSQTYGKEKWLIDAFHCMKQFPNVRAVAWNSGQWRSGGEIYMDWRLNSSPTVAETFRKCVADPYFLGPVPYRGQRLSNPRVRP